IAPRERVTGAEVHPREYPQTFQDIERSVHRCAADPMRPQLVDQRLGCKRARFVGDRVHDQLAPPGQPQSLFVQAAQHPLRPRQIASASCHERRRLAHCRLTLAHKLRHADTIGRVLRRAVASCASVLVLLLVWAPRQAGATYMNQPRPVRERVEELLNQMTLPEKVGQMDQILITHVTERATSPACPSCFGDADPTAMQTVLIDNFAGSLLAGGTEMPHDTTHSGGLGNTGRDWAATYNAIQSFAIQRSRLHIPVLFGVDAVHGFSHPFEAPLFPHQIGMGATWDTSLAETAGVTTANALRATGWVLNFAPVQDVFRDNRWGRAYETWFEEAVLAGARGAAHVRARPAPPPSDGGQV